MRVSTPSPVAIPPISIATHGVFVAEKNLQANENTSSDPSTPRGDKALSHSPTSSLVSKIEACWPKKRSRPGGFESERGSSIKVLPSHRLFCETDWQLKRRKLRLKKLSKKGVLIAGLGSVIDQCCIPNVFQIWSWLEVWKLRLSKI